MAYLGRVRQGDYLPLRCWCRHNGTPTMPTQCPTAQIWGPTGAAVGNYVLPIIDRYAVTALFQFLLYLNASNFAALGNYRVTYRIPSTTGGDLDEDTFEVVAGGGTKGNLIAMYYWNRPWSQFIVNQNDANVIALKRNPRIDQ